MDGLKLLMRSTSPTAAVIISIALMLFCGFAITRVTKRARLPDVTAYILTGILLGPYCLDLIPANIIAGSDFLSDIALAFIAFSVGEFLKTDTLKKNGVNVVIITLLEACVASVLVFCLMYYVLRLNLAFSIVLAALASATAPASTMMTIRQTHARGDFVDTLLQVVALDDVVGLVLYSVAISVALSSLSGAGAGMNLQTVITPIIINLLVLVLGGAFGFLLKLMMPVKRSTDNRLIISVSLLLAFCGICALLDVSPLLGCMSMGLVYINITGDEKLFKQLNYFSPPILLLFFVRSGMSFKLDSLLSGSGLNGGVSLLTIGILYFFVRIIGKYAGAYAGCLAVKKSPDVRNYLGLALIPQAGVAIGLAALCARTLGPDVGGDLQTIILASSVLYEMIGPACAKLSLYLSHSYSNKLEDITSIAPQISEPTPNSVDVLIARIGQIRAQSRLSASLPDSNEEAYNSAIEEQYEALLAGRNSHFLNRR